MELPSGSLFPNIVYGLAVAVVVYLYFLLFQHWDSSWISNTVLGLEVVVVGATIFGRWRQAKGPTVAEDWTAGINKSINLPQGYATPSTFPAYARITFGLLIETHAATIGILFYCLLDEAFRTSSLKYLGPLAIAGICLSIFGFVRDMQNATKVGSMSTTKAPGLQRIVLTVFNGITLTTIVCIFAVRAGLPF